MDHRRAPHLWRAPSWAEIEAGRRPGEIRMTKSEACIPTRYIAVLLW